MHAALRVRPCGIPLLGSSGVIVFIAGILLVALGVTLQAGATGAVRAIKMSAALTVLRSPRHPAPGKL